MLLISPSLNFSRTSDGTDCTIPSFLTPTGIADSAADTPLLKRLRTNELHSTVVLDSLLPPHGRDRLSFQERQYLIALGRPPSGSNSWSEVSYSTAKECRSCYNTT